VEKTQVRMTANKSVSVLITRIERAKKQTRRSFSAAGPRSALRPRLIANRVLGGRLSQTFRRAHGDAEGREHFMADSSSPVESGIIEELE